MIPSLLHQSSALGRSCTKDNSLELLNLRLMPLASSVASSQTKPCGHLVSSAEVVARMVRAIVDFMVSGICKEQKRGKQKKGQASVQNEAVMGNGGHGTAKVGEPKMLRTTLKNLS